jgi:hypothetical protein
MRAFALRHMHTQVFATSHAYGLGQSTLGLSFFSNLPLLVKYFFKKILVYTHFLIS